MAKKKPLFPPKNKVETIIENDSSLENLSLRQEEVIKQIKLRKDFEKISSSIKNLIQ